MAYIQQIENKQYSGMQGAMSSFIFSRMVPLELRLIAHRVWR